MSTRFLFIIVWGMDIVMIQVFDSCSLGQWDICICGQCDSLCQSMAKHFGWAQTFLGGGQTAQSLGMAATGNTLSTNLKNLKHIISFSKCKLLSPDKFDCTLLLNQLKMCPDWLGRSGCPVERANLFKNQSHFHSFLRWTMRCWC